MKCQKCGKDNWGSAEVCAYCGNQLKTYFACRKCGTQNKADALFCSSCGNQLKEITYFTCRKCGTQNKADALFCVSCGSSLEMICKKCGMENKEGAKFCVSCGAPLANRFSMNNYGGSRSEMSNSQSNTRAIVGAMFTISGVALAIYGASKNNSYSSRWDSVLSGGSLDPGTVFIVIGVIVALVGFIMMMIGLSKK